MPQSADEVVEDFHRLYYDSHDRTWTNTSWRGVETWKCPLDLWVYQEMFHELQPDLVIETGTAHGGSAYFMASLFDLMGTGTVLSIDIDDRRSRPQHPRIEYFTGSSVEPPALDRARELAGRAERVLVILDSDHSQAHVRAELEVYAPLVTPGSYLVVEDTNVHGHPVLLEHGPGPMEALDDFLAQTDEFVIDASREKYFLTFNPRGFLKRVPAGSGVALPGPVRPARWLTAPEPVPAPAPQPAPVQPALVPLGPPRGGLLNAAARGVDGLLRRRGLALARQAPPASSSADPADPA